MRSAVTRCRRTLAMLGRAGSETGLPEPQTLAGWADLTEAWAKAGEVLSAMTPAVYEIDLQAACEALAPAGRGSRRPAVGGADLGRYRAARAQLRAALPPGRKLGDRDLYSRAVAAPGQRPHVGWPRRPRDPACPAHGSRMPGVLRAPARPARPAGSMVRADRPGPDAGQGRRADPEPRLTADRGTLARLPELRRLRTSLQSAGLGEFLAGMAARQASEDFAVRAFWHAWLSSILDYLELTDLPLGSFTADAQDTTVREFRGGDRRPHRDDLGADPPRLRRERGTGTRRVQGPGRARPAPGRAEAAAHARPRPRPQHRRRPARPQALLGDEPARRQPAAAAEDRTSTSSSSTRPRRSPPPTRSRRSCAAGSWSSPAMRSSSRRPPSSSPEHRARTTTSPNRTRRRPLIAGTRGLRVDPRRARLAASASGMLALALPKPRRAADRLLERPHLRPHAHHLPRRRRRRSVLSLRARALAIRAPTRTARPPRSTRSST